MISSTPDAGVRRVSGRVLMKTLYTVALVAQARPKVYTVSVLLLLLGLVLPTGEAVSQQAGPTFHRYLVRAVLTVRSGM